MNTSFEQLQALDEHGKTAVLFYLAGRLSKSAEFQEALTAAYNDEMRFRARVESEDRK